MPTLQEWLVSASGGAESHSSALIWPYVSPHTQSRSVGCALPGLSKNQELLKIPGHLILTAERAKDALLGKEVSESAELKELLEDKDELALGLAILAVVGAAASTDSSSLPESAPLSSSPAVQRLLGFSVYARSLPDNSDFRDVLSLWSEGELAALENREAARAAKERREELRDDYKAVKAAIEKYCLPSSSAAPPVLTAWDCLKASFCWENYLWARFCVQSRAFIDGLAMGELFACEGTKDLLPIAMVPLADMFNHYAPSLSKKLQAIVSAPTATTATTGAAETSTTALPPIILDADWQPSDSTSSPSGSGSGSGSGFYVLRCLKAYPEPTAMNRELGISYGDRSSLDLLENYGFSLPYPHNAHETMTASVGFLLEAALGSCLGEEDYTDQEKDEFSEQFVAAARSVLSSSSVVSPSLQDTKRQSHESEFCSPKSVDFPCKDSPGSDILCLFRMLAADETDLAAVFPASTPSKKRFLSPELCEKPISRENEVRVLRLLQLTLAKQLAPLLAMPQTQKLSGKAKTESEPSPSAATTAATIYSATALLRTSASDLLNACRTKVAEEAAIQETLKTQLATLTAVASTAPKAEALVPWPCALPLQLLSDASSSSAAAGGTTASAGDATTATTTTTALRRLLLASQYRQGQFAVGALQLSYVSRMLELADANLRHGQ